MGIVVYLEIMLYLFSIYEQANRCGLAAGGLEVLVPNIKDINCRH